MPPEITTVDDTELDEIKSWRARVLEANQNVRAKEKECTLAREASTAAKAGWKESVAELQRVLEERAAGPMLPFNARDDEDDEDEADEDEEPAKEAQPVPSGRWQDTDIANIEGFTPGMVKMLREQKLATAGELDSWLVIGGDVKKIKGFGPGKVDTFNAAWTEFRRQNETAPIA